MPRRPSTDANFGSDSFLDVVCNIVGILIILIVIAGVRVSRAPVLTFTPRPVEPAAEQTIPESASPFSGQERAAEPPPTPAEVDADEVAALEQQLEEVDLQQQLLTTELERSRGQLAAALERQTALQERLAQVRSSTEKTQSELATTQQAVATSTTELATLKQLAAQLAAQIRTAQLQPDQAQRLEHRITPVGRTVTGDELHFRLEHNRVSVVPLEALLLRLKEQIERRKEMFAKARQHEGQVGPIDGYTLRYLVQRDHLSVVDELRYGPGMFRISVAHWELDVDRDMIAETVSEALRPGSRFYQALLEAKNESALTFWVYPDSFEAFTQLKAACHAQNFLVAGRPLPEGFPIAGSPRGTRSSGQ